MNVKIELSEERYIVITCDKYQYITEFFGKNDNEESDNFGKFTSKGKIFHPKIGQLIQALARHELPQSDVKTLAEMSEFIQRLHDLVVDGIESREQAK